MDLLAPYPRLGILAVNYCATSMIVYRAKSWFFEDSLISLPVMTFLFAEVSTLLHALLLGLFASGPVVSWTWIATDLLLLPLLDAFYAWIWFAFPAHLLRRRPAHVQRIIGPKRLF